MKPEDEAREDIDRQLIECGWEVQDRRSMNLFPGGVDVELNAIAVREFPVTKPGRADRTLAEVRQALTKKAA